MEAKTTSDKLQEAFKMIKKNRVAELLDISRPTLDSKLENDNFKPEEILILIEHNIISGF